MNSQIDHEIQLFRRVLDHNLELELSDSKLVYRGKESVPKSLVEELRANKDQIREVLSAQQTYMSSQGAVNHSEEPASWCEHAVWAASQISGNPAAYRPIICLKFTECLEKDPLTKAFKHLLIEQPILRARFVLDQSSKLLRRRITSYIPPVERISIENDADIVTVLKQEVQREIDVSEEALCKAYLVCSGKTHDILMVVFHHLVVDGWSTRLFIERLSELYRLYCRREVRPAAETQLYPGPMTSADVLTESGFSQAKAFWLRQFESFSMLAIGQAQSAELNHDQYPQLHKYAVPSEKRRLLLDLCRSLGCTVSEVWLSLLLINLRLSTGSQACVINTVFHNRQTQETQNRFGTFSTELPLVFPSIMEKSFAEIVADVRKISSRVQKYQFFPRYALQRLIHSEFAPDQIPSIDKFHYVFQKIAGGPAWGCFEGAATMDIGAIEEDVPLKLVVQEIGDEIVLEIKGDGSVLTEIDFTVFSGRFESLLTLFCDYPDLIAERCIESVLDKEQSGLANEGVNLVSDIRKHAESAPNAVAVRYAGTQILYPGLVSLVDFYRQELSVREVKEGDRLALVLNPGIHAIALVLALIEQKAVYVPIDPSSSAAYKERLCASAGIKYVVSQERLSGDLQFESGPAQGDRKMRGVQAPELAVVFTSGSTGIPKGVRCSVAGLAQRHDVLRHRIPVSSSDTVYVKSPMSVVDFIIECLSSLRVGACLVIPTVDERKDPFSLVELCERYQVTKLEIVPSQFRALLPESRRKLGQTVSLRCVVFTGEAFPDDLLSEIQTVFCSADIYNRYGLTEAAAAVVTKISAQRRPFEVGWPTPGVDIKVIPATATEQSPGHVFVAGRALALGYVSESWRRYALEEGRVWFATGEKGWIADDGQLLIKGRIDHEVKVRGFRVNLAEVESVLQAHPEVQRAAVALRGSSEEPELVALVETNGEGALPQRLNEHLKASFPDHAVPGRFICVPRLPETIGGKLDRIRCQSIIDDSVKNVALQQRSSPDLDSQVLAAVCKTSHLFSECSLDSDFLEMGADSLVLARLVQVIRRETGVRVPLKYIYAQPTISALVDRIRAESDYHYNR